MSYLVGYRGIKATQALGGVCLFFALLTTFNLRIDAQTPFDAVSLIELAKTHSPELAESITKAFSITSLRNGTAVRSHLSHFFFSFDSTSKPRLVIDGAAAVDMQSIEGTNLWFHISNLSTGTIHSYSYIVDGKPIVSFTDLPSFGPEAYLQPNVSAGKILGPFTQVSKIYDGMKSTYWMYIPAQYDSKIPAALMVIQDGQGYMSRQSERPFLNVLDNLMAEKKIPIIICVFIAPGTISGAIGTPTYNSVKAFSDKWKYPLESSMRSVLYDTVSDRYPRFLRDELLPQVYAKYNIRRDAYSHAIGGLSSGGICSFNVAWQMPDQFSRVLSWIGSFVSLQWEEDPSVHEGGQDYPDMVLRGPKRNIRVWLQDGSRDMQDNYFSRNFGNWPASNLRMANALKLAGYDFHFSFGDGTHNSAQGAVELPNELTWLWRAYDPSKTEQVFEQDSEEKSKPPFRFVLVDRDTDR